MYGRYGEEHGATKLPDLFAERNWLVMYPPLSIYQAAAIGKIGANRLAGSGEELPGRRLAYLGNADHPAQPAQEHLWSMLDDIAL